MSAFQLGSVRFDGQELVVVAHADRLVDLNALFGAAGGAAPALHSVMDLMEQWSEWIAGIEGLLDRFGEDVPALEEPLEWLAPVRFPRKFIGIGANYYDHLKEMGNPPPPSLPYSFLFPASTGLRGTGADIEIPPSASMIDYEAELAVVIGYSARHVRAEKALEYVAGYSVLNDVSARDWNAKPSPVGIDWVMSKGFDGFKPMGPFVTPARFVANPQVLRIRAWVNGELRQDGNTRDMVFSVADIIAHLSGIMTLEPGDVIATGTPAGVGHGRRPPLHLQAGDTVTVEIDGLGRLTNQFHVPTTLAAG